MDLRQLLLQKKKTILERWFHLITETYPSDSLGFLKQGNDRFTNPVGYTISQATASIFDILLDNKNPDKLAEHLDNIIRMRAVQGFSPSQSVSFVFLLKKAIREEINKEVHRNQYFDELLKFESQIDEVSLLALEIFTRCREKLHEIRLNEIKAERERAIRLLEKADLLYFIREETAAKEGSQET